VLIEGDGLEPMPEDEERAAIAECVETWWRLTGRQLGD
jgi:hypothetical protein